MDKIYIITGANGHLGNTIVRQLLNEGKIVRALVLKNDKINSLKGLDCKIFYGDVCVIQSLKEIFTVDKHTEIVVIHCAGIVTIASKFLQKVYDVNVMGTKNVVDMCMENHVSKLIYVSSVHALEETKDGTPIVENTSFDKEKVDGLYSQTKAEASQYVLDKCKEGLNACIVNPSGIIGPYDFGRGHLTELVIDYLKGSLTACIHGGYDFVDVRDVANGIIKSVDRGEAGESYILSNKHYEIVEILNMLADVNNKKRINIILPMWFAKFTAPLSELYYKILRQPPLYTKYSLVVLYSKATFSNKKAKEKLGYTTRFMEETLKDTSIWLKKNGRI